MPNEIRKQLDGALIRLLIQLDKRRAICRRRLKSCEAEKQGGIRESVVAVVTRGHTGRTSHTDLWLKRAKEWAATKSKWKLAYHVGARDFFRRLEAVDCLTDPIRCYRGRQDDGNVDSWRDMGPPPASALLEGGRYNRERDPVLYLCDSQNAVRREKPGEFPLVIQEYKLDPENLRIADLANNELHSLIRSVFDLAEQAKLPSYNGPDDFRFSQRVAELVEVAGYDGMVVPGVRGDPDFRYRNVIVFEPEGRWRRWSMKAKGYQEIDN